MASASCAFGERIGPERVPTTIGVVQDRRIASSGDLTVSLIGQPDVVLPADAERLTPNSTVEPGSLLLADLESKPWLVSFPQIRDCYHALTDYAELRGANVVTEEGLVLPKSDSFQAGPAGDDGRFDSPYGTVICVDEHGLALSAE
jgi:hypothetical protein